MSTLVRQWQLLLQHQWRRLHLQLLEEAETHLQLLLKRLHPLKKKKKRAAASAASAIFSANLRSCNYRLEPV